MKPKHQVAVFLAIVIIPISWFISFFFAWSMGEGRYYRGDFSAGQQKEIAEALGFDIAPGEVLTALYQLRAPGVIDYLEIDIGGIPSEEDFLSRCHEETLRHWKWDDSMFDVDEGGATFCSYAAGVGQASFVIPKKVQKHHSSFFSISKLFNP